MPWSSCPSEALLPSFPTGFVSEANPILLFSSPLQPPVNPDCLTAWSSTGAGNPFNSEQRNFPKTRVRVHTLPFSLKPHSLPWLMRSYAFWSSSPSLTCFSHPLTSHNWLLTTLLKNTQACSHPRVFAYAVLAAWFATCSAPRNWLLPHSRDKLPGQPHSWAHPDLMDRCFSILFILSMSPCLTFSLPERWLPKQENLHSAQCSA